MLDLAFPSAAVRVPAAGKMPDLMQRDAIRLPVANRRNADATPLPICAPVLFLIRVHDADAISSRNYLDVFPKPPHSAISNSASKITSMIAAPPTCLGRNTTPAQPEKAS
jgi:hypothetical protein